MRLLVRILLVPLVFTVAHLFGCLLSDMVSAARMAASEVEVDANCAADVDYRLLAPNPYPSPRKPLKPIIASEAGSVPPTAELYALDLPE
jgi:hypothetical protein